MFLGRLLERFAERREDAGLAQEAGKRSTRDGLRPRLRKLERELVWWPAITFSDRDEKNRWFGLGGGGERGSRRCETCHLEAQTQSRGENFREKSLTRRFNELQKNLLKKFQMRSGYFIVQFASASRIGQELSARACTPP